MTVDRKMLARKAGDDEVLLAFAEMYAQFTDEVLIQRQRRRCCANGTRM